MGENYMHRLVRKAALMLAVLLLLVAPAPDTFALHVHGEVLSSGKDIADKINLKSLIISIDNEVIYDSTDTLLSPSVCLKPDSTMSFSLRWNVSGNGIGFQDKDYFSIPVVYVDGLRLTEPFIQALELDGGDGQNVEVAEGKFTYSDGLLAFQVVFNRNATNYQIEGGPAGGYAELNLSNGQTELLMTFSDSQTVTVDVDTEPGVKPLPSLPTYPSTLPTMNKAVFSPNVNGSTINLLARYATMQLSDERKFGLDWRMTFFDLVPHFQGGGAATENVIIEEIVGKGQEFANFAGFAAGDRDKGFTTINDEDYEAPFFIEVPIVAVGSNRIYNLYGDDTLSADSRNGYISTLIRADQMQEISGGDVEDKVRQRPLSWGIEELDDGREKLIINLGKLGPGVSKGQGLTADLVKEKDYPYAVLDGVIIVELLTAQRMIEAGGADVNQWERVRKESLHTILHYWPGYRNKLCSIAGISAGSDTAALEKALFAMTYDKLSQSRITTLGYDERRTGGIAGTMQIDSFVLRYRTVLSSVADTDISNSVKITTGILNRKDSASYRHQFYAGIFGTVNVGEIAFIKANVADGHSSGETTEEAIRDIRGLAGAEFEVYEANGGTPLRFVKNGSVYELRADGDVIALRSDEDGGFKITGLLPAKDYALYEKAAPLGYQLPEQRYTVFHVSGSTSKYYVITNIKKPTTSDTPDKPDIHRTPNTPDTPDKPDTPDIDIPSTDIPDTDVPLTDVPKSGDNSNVRLAAALMLMAMLVMVVLTIEPYRKMRMR